jgi:hypothetical protein
LTAIESTDLTSANEVEHERREDVGLLGDSVGERCADFDVTSHRREGFRQLFVFGLLGNDCERAEQRESRGDHRRDLSTRDRQVLGLDPLLEDPDVEVTVEAGAGRGLRDRNGGEPHGAHSRNNRRLARSLELALDDLASGVTSRVGVCECCHQ